MIRARIRAQPQEQKRYSDWFQNEVFFPRAVRAVALSTLLFSLGFWLTSLLIALPGLPFLHPLSALHDLFWVVFSPKSLLFVFLSSVLFCGFSCTAVSVIRVSASPSKPNGAAVVRFALCFLADLTQRLIFTFYCLETGQSKYSSNEEDSYCVGRRFLFFAQMIFGFVGFVKIARKSGHLLKFPIVNQNVLVLLGNRAEDVTKESCKSGLVQLKFSLLAFLLGGYKLLNGLLDYQMTFTGVLWAFVDVPLIWNAFLLLAFQDIMARTTYILINAVMTEPLTFDLPSLDSFNPLDEPRKPNLPVALEMRSPPLLEILAFLDFAQLSKSSVSRRASIFSVSQPGGHPWNWTAILETSTRVLSRFTEEIGQKNAELGIAWNSRVDPNAQSSPGSHNERKNLLQPRHIRIRNSAIGFSGSAEANGPMGKGPAAETKAVASERPSGGISKTILAQFLPWRGSSTEEWIPNDPEIIVWTIEGLSYLVHHSYREDVLGVVQKELGRVIGLLTDVYVETDKHCRLTGSGQSMAKRGVASEVNAIRHSTELALYRIKEIFEPHFGRDIQLSDTHLAYLSSLQQK